MLKITALLENKARINGLIHYSGLSLLLEDNHSKILFDTGKDIAFLANAQKLHIDLTTVDLIVISHGHYDHFGGLTQIPKPFFSSPPTVIAHPHLFSSRYSALFLGSKAIKLKQLNPNFEQLELHKQFNFHFTTEPYLISRSFIYSGEITERKVNKRYGVIDDGNNQTDDYVLDDSFLVWKGKNGLVIITGCSHSGIESIIAHARKITGQYHIQAIVGGLHLRAASLSALKSAKNAIEPKTRVYGCHCTGVLGRSYLNANDFNAGEVLSFE